MHDYPKAMGVITVIITAMLCNVINYYIIPIIIIINMNNLLLLLYRYKIKFLESLPVRLGYASRPSIGYLHYY